VAITIERMGGSVIVAASLFALARAAGQTVRVVLEGGPPWQSPRPPHHRSDRGEDG